MSSGISSINKRHFSRFRTIQGAASFFFLSSVCFQSRWKRRYNFGIIALIHWSQKNKSHHFLFETSQLVSQLTGLWADLSNAALHGGDQLPRAPPLPDQREHLAQRTSEHLRKIQSQQWDRLQERRGATRRFTGLCLEQVVLPTWLHGPGPCTPGYKTQRVLQGQGQRPKAELPGMSVLLMPGEGDLIEIKNIILQKRSLLNTALPAKLCFMLIQCIHALRAERLAGKDRGLFVQLCWSDVRAFYNTSHYLEETDICSVLYPKLWWKPHRRWHRTLSVPKLSVVCWLQVLLWHLAS